METTSDTVDRSAVFDADAATATAFTPPAAGPLPAAGAVTDGGDRSRSNQEEEEDRAPPSPHPSWTMPLSRAPPNPEVHAFARPPMLEALRMLPIAARVGAHIFGERRAGREPIFDMNGIALEPPHPGPWAGAPLGGLGSGALGRGYRGEVRRWSVHPGRYLHRASHAVAQFALRIARKPATDGGEGASAVSALEVHTKVLSVFSPGPGDLEASGVGQLSEWDWGVPPDSVTYHAVFPRAWTEYREPVPGVIVTIHQLSPFIPHSYSESSLPVGLFEVTIVDLWPDRPLQEASVMLFSANDDGCSDRETRARRACPSSSGVTHSSFCMDVSNNDNPASPLHRAVGVLMTRPYDMQEPSTSEAAYVGSAPMHMGSISIAAMEHPGRTTASTCCMIDALPAAVVAKGALTSSQIWHAFTATGDLTGFPAANSLSASAGGGAYVVGAVCLKFSGPGANECGTLNFQFSLCWDFPLLRFGSGRVLPRYYSRFFGTSGLASSAMATFALSRCRNWARRIHDWQMGGALGDASLPDFYRYTLYNELYFLVDGGSIWLNTVDADSKLAATSMLSDLIQSTGPLSPLRSFNVDEIVTRLRAHDDNCSRCDGNATEVGQFLYLEGHEYLMYNTYDVHFYASFALLMLWPQLELSIQRDFAKCVPIEDLTERTMLGHGDRKPRKLAGCVPHDLGSPSEDPFVKTNVYNFQDVSKWKDLGPKFVLQVLRDYMQTLSIEFLRAVYPTVQSVMNSTHEFDTDGDGMIENGGFPDQTYDIWIAKGVSAYCGGLWIAACFATSAIAKILEDTATHVRYTELGDSARTAYIKKLWNGSYLNYDENQSSHSDSIMADMLAGHWFCRICDLPPILSTMQAISCLKTIFNMNVITFSELNGGHIIGAVNGMRPDGRVDNSCLQSREVWTGVTYGVAATMLEEAQLVSEYLEKTKIYPRADESNSFVFDDKYGLGSASEEDLKELPFLLTQMAYDTAKGIHDGGWQRFGYWFATPEAWESSGHYRSLGYMRPLSVWAIELARKKKM